jgi:hypothetical protein
MQNHNLRPGADWFTVIGFAETFQNSIFSIGANIEPPASARFDLIDINRRSNAGFVTDSLDLSGGPIGLPIHSVKNLDIDDGQRISVDASGVHAVVIRM